MMEKLRMCCIAARELQKRVRFSTPSELQDPEY
jgi:hypothetical protein